MHGVLSGRTIQEEVDAGKIKIEPFNPANVNPASYDLTLGNQVAVYAGWVECFRFGYEPTGPVTGPRSDRICDGRHFRPLDKIMDVREKPEIQSFTIDAEVGWVLRPGIGYLMHTNERVSTNHYVPVVDGKSSIGRLFAMIHVTAGYGDPGFDGQYTLEVAVTHQLRVFPGMRIGQMRFHTIVGEPDLYGKNGHYTGAFADGPVPSRAYTQFPPKEDR